MSLPTRKIGDTEVTAIGFGAMGLSTGYGEVPPDDERLQVFTLSSITSFLDTKCQYTLPSQFLDTVYSRGCTFWDTADAYADNEELIGKWFQRSGKRDDIFLATKFGLEKLIKRESDIPRAEPEYVAQAIQSSLKRLQTDRVDLYYLHRCAHISTQIERSLMLPALLDPARWFQLRRPSLRWPSS